MKSGVVSYEGFGRTWCLKFEFWEWERERGVKGIWKIKKLYIVIISIVHTGCLKRPQRPNALEAYTDLDLTLKT